MPTYHIHIEGQVQGVGFRPYVYRLAGESGLRGWVSNTNDGVHIEIEAKPEEANMFYQCLVAKAPPMSLILRHSIREVKEGGFRDFQIVDSREGGEARLLMTPDFAICEDCRRELHSADNRRSGYPFITCTNCGPRFSIITGLPYDRERTTMEPFAMCPACREEYDAPLDRRYYSQTNSCPACSIQLSLYDNRRELLSLDNRSIVQQAARLWQDGKTIAIKGVGGYLLTCDATNARAVEELRRRKHRPAKPFALMYPGIPTLEQDAELSQEARELLLSPAAPIVLLPVKARPASGIAAEPIAPGLGQIGVMLPYTPLYELLLREFGRPIVATSGNVSGAPICYEDEDALATLSPVADYLLLNNRDIATPQDDSVVRLSPAHRQRIVLRRSRGYAPTLLPPVAPPSKEVALAAGADLKSTFTLMQAGNFYASQYLGALGALESQERFRQTVEHFLRLFNVQPDVILTDRHPGYFSTQLGQELARQWGIPAYAFQHHEAHFAALLGEHGLLHAEEPVLGIVWDGLGLGDDGQIWGGEFFLYDNYAFTRIAQLEYFNYSLGDKIAREPRLSALMASQGLEAAEPWLRPKFSATEWNIYRQLLGRPASIRSSSAGRLFDAVASLLTGRDICTFEGEAAMLLEQMACRYCRQNGLEMDGYYDCLCAESGNISTARLMSDIYSSLAKGEGREEVAARFHYSLVKAIGLIAARTEARKLAFSGGVFQNALLVDMAREQLGKKYELLFHRHLPPNDEGVSFGQLMRYFIDKERGIEIPGPGLTRMEQGRP